MRAFVRIDPHDQVVELAEVPAHEPDAGEVSVALEAFGVGIHDRYFIPPDGPFPYTIGVEGAGVVDAIGAGVDDVEVGDRVAVSASMNPKGGTWTERVVVGRAGIRSIPDELDFTTAAGIPVAASTAVESMHALDLHEGETFYVAGASGAIGTLIVQMATRRGARVVGSASASNHDYLRSLGAEYTVDYHDDDWPDQVRNWSSGGVDAALAIQPGTPPSSLTVVRDGGRVITVSGDPCPSERGVRVAQFDHGAAPLEAMTGLIQDITDGRVQLVLEHVYDFEDALTALEKTETRHARGKLVVRVVPAH